MRDRISKLALTSLAAALAMASLVHAQDPGESGAVERLLVDRTLETELVDLLEIDESRVRFRDEHGLIRSRPRNELIAIIPEDLTWDVSGDSVLELVGGERFTGSLVIEKDPGEMILWKSQLFGHIKTSLEFVRRIVLRPDDDRDPPEDLAGDALVLTNGDVLSGFLISLGQTASIESDTGVIDLPVSRVASAHIAAGLKSPGADRGVRVWLNDGTIAAIQSIRRAPGSTGYELGMQSPSEADEIDGTRTPARIAAEEIRAVVFETSALRSLAAIPPHSQHALAGRRWSEAVVVEPLERSILKLAAIEIPGPMRVTWLLPEGALRLGLEAELPEESRLWGHCSLVVSAAVKGRESELARRTLSQDTPTTDLSIEVPNGAESLSIAVEPGRYGPIQDRVVLKRAMLLVAP